METLRTNAKHLSPGEQYGLRKIIVRMLKQGRHPLEVARLLEVSRSLVYATRKAYEERGLDGIKEKRRGRRSGEKRRLTLEQEQEIRGLILDRCPEQLKLPGCMWSRRDIGELIERRYGIQLIPSTLGYFLSRWGFSVQRPVKRADRQDERKVADWVDQAYPKIAARARKEGGEVFFGEETGVQNTANYARGYAPIGQTPVVRVTSKKMKINMLSAISNRGKLRFVLYKDNMNAGKLIDFMRRLISDIKKKVFLILDNLRAHHARKTTAWLEKHQEKIEVFFLPPYAPEYNPDELLNSDLKRNIGDLKRNIGNRPMPRSEAELEHNARSHLKSVQLRPEKIKSFFHAKFTS
jgi:transposase